MYLGIDLGTQSVKVVLVDRAGQVIRTAQESYPIHRPQSGWAEQKPAEWWRGVVNAVQSAARHYADQIIAIGLSGQMHGVVLLDAKDEVLRPAIIWMDQRSAHEATALQASHSDWLQLAYNTLSPGMAGASLLWLRQHQPAVLAQTKTLLQPKDWLRFKLTGAKAAELSDAAGSLLLDIGQRRWSDRLLDLYGVEKASLPPLVESSQIVGTLNPNAAAELGLPTAIKVAAGAADQAAMLTGSGVLEDGQAALTIGTGGQMSVVVTHPTPDPRLNTFCHAAPQRWYSMGAILAAGYALSWWQKITGGRLETLLKRAADAPPGCEGLIFRPYLNGERTPHMNPSLTAQFVGLTGRHTQSHLTRAVLEGVAFAMRDCLEALRGAGAAPNRMIFGGGGAKGELWRRIMASTLNLPLTTLKGGEQTALGAAMLAAVGSGQFASLEQAASAWVQTESEIVPNTDWAAIYQERYEVYKNG